MLVATLNNRRTPEEKWRSKQELLKKNSLEVKHME